MKVKFYILGIKRNFRGEDLFNCIEATGFDVEIVWGVDATLDPLKEFRDDSKSQFFYRRKLTNGEIACTLGHRMIAKKAQLDHVDIAIVLEDDVQISSPVDVVSSVEDMPQKTPTLLLLIVDPRLTLTVKTQVYFRKDGNRRAVSNPSPTSAYALNQSAVKYIVGLDESELKGFQADFPVNWFRKVKYLVSTEVSQYISLAPVQSLITHRMRGFNDSDGILIRLLKLMSPCSFIRARRYGVSFTGYCAHFLFRALAWRLERKNETF